MGACKAMGDKDDKKGTVQWISRSVSGSGTEPSAARLALKQAPRTSPMSVIARKQTIGPLTRSVADRRSPSIPRSLASNPLFEVPTVGLNAGASSEKNVQHGSRLL